MKKKEPKKEEAPVMPKGQLIRLRKLFSIRLGTGASEVNNSRLN